MAFNYDAAPDDTGTAAPTLDAAVDASVPLAPKAEPRKRAVLVGNANVGKSVVFGALTGTYVTVSNYPGTTVEITRGRATIHGDDTDEPWEIIDTPGTNNLVPMSEDESVTRDVLIGEPHDALIQVGDAKSLTRSLLLTLQLAELGIPFCLNLNMMDEARARGIELDLDVLRAELPGVMVNVSVAVDGEGLAPLHDYLRDRPERASGRVPLDCAAAFQPDVEAAIAVVEAVLPEGFVARRAIATMLLGDEKGDGAGLIDRVGAKAVAIARAEGGKLRLGNGMPVFALLSRQRLTRAQAIVRKVQRRSEHRTVRARHGQAGTRAATIVAVGAAAIAGLAYDGALTASQVVGVADPTDDFNFFDVAGRALSSSLWHGWNATSLALMAVVGALSFSLVRRHAQARAAVWKLVFAYAAGYAAFFLADTLEPRFHGVHTPFAVHAGGIAGLLALAFLATAGDSRDEATSQRLGKLATHPVWGLPILAVVLFFAYKVVGVFGAGTAVDFVENKLFGNVSAEAPLDSSPPSVPPGTPADEGDVKLLISPLPAPDAEPRVRITAVVKTKDGYDPIPASKLAVYAGKERLSVSESGDALVVTGSLNGATARAWQGYLNRWAYAFFAAFHIPMLTAFMVGQYGLITMGVTYAVAIVLPVVATFFFVFSMLEDSGYLPRLAVMTNRGLRGMGLNGKAVLPMILGLGCDTMATLTARIMETKKERVLVTLLLALGIPCSSQLSVIFAMMQRTSRMATLVWMFTVIFTLLFVGYVAAKVIPGDKSDFLLEMPPIRRPMLGNLTTKTFARIEWYLREAVPLFLVGTALLFFLDAFNLLRYVHAAGEPIVHHVLGFPREGAVSDRVSEALLIGFLRRDFGAAGLLSMARAGQLSAADVAVSMVTITLFIPCIANVLIIVKERGWKVAGMMSGFIFPYAVLVGALVRILFRATGG